MKINIGNNNKIKNSTIGNDNNNTKEKDNKIIKIIIDFFFISSSVIFLFLLFTDFDILYISLLLSFLCYLQRY